MSAAEVGSPHRSWEAQLRARKKKNMTSLRTESFKTMAAEVTITHIVSLIMALMLRFASAIFGSSFRCQATYSHWDVFDNIQRVSVT